MAELSFGSQNLQNKKRNVSYFEFEAHFEETLICPNISSVETKTYKNKKKIVNIKKKKFNLFIYWDGSALLIKVSNPLR